MIFYLLYFELIFSFLVVSLVETLIWLHMYVMDHFSFSHLIKHMHFMQFLQVIAVNSLLLLFHAV